MNTYLFVLGRNPGLSRAELTPFCDEVLYDAEKSLLIAENIRFENPRNIPREPEQLFLDRFGGTIRFGEIIGELRSPIEVKNKIFHTAQNEKSEGKIHLGISAWGCGRSFLKSFLPELKDKFKNQGRNCRIVNAPGQSLDSGKIFGEKLLRKGFEFLVWKKGDSFLLAKTVANQNLRNYTLRDREKQFRDSKMGMLPPKLAQILINLADPQWNQTIIDPFCGSGTINIEAAIMGFQTIGSDIEERQVTESQKNFDQMAEKFRYEEKSGQFVVTDALQFPFQKYDQGVVVTEGFLGTNFVKRPEKSAIEQDSRDIVKLWEKIFQRLEDSTIQTVVFCLPHWKLRNETISIAEKVFSKTESSSYEPQSNFEGKKTFVYARPDAFVGREICVMRRQNI